MNDMIIEAGARAFGDGSHPTTQGTLAALGLFDPAEFRPAIACDMGCGSGITSLDVVRRFGCPVVAVDTMTEAVETTRTNAVMNGYAEKVLALQADGFSHPDIAAHAPFDLIVMNILAEPVLRLAADTHTHLAPGGAIILGGILSWQEQPIIEAYQVLGMEMTSRLTLGDWVTQIWQKPELA